MTQCSIIWASVVNAYNIFVLEMVDKLQSGGGALQLTDIYLNRPWDWDMYNSLHPWWRHQMETFYALLSFYEGNPSVTGGFPSQRPVTRTCYAFFDLRLNKQLSK